MYELTNVLRKIDSFADGCLQDNADYQKLMSMHGLGSVKKSVTELMTLQLQNYDAELRGDRIQTISLHRVFMGNSGTGT